MRDVSCSKLSIKNKYVVEKKIREDYLDTFAEKNDHGKVIIEAFNFQRKTFFFLRSL